MMRRLGLAAFLTSVACASGGPTAGDEGPLAAARALPPGETPTDGASGAKASGEEAPKEAPSPARPRSAGGPRAPSPWAAVEPAAPWWAELQTGLYDFAASVGDGAWLLSVGHSAGHHHAAEGLLGARVQARLGLREASRDEPRLIDLYITTDREFFVLYGVPQPDAEAAPPLHAPPPFSAPGRHLVGRHLFEDDQHLYLECDVEGPLANPDWGSDRVSAQLTQEP